MENQYEQLKQEFESLNDRFLQQKQNLMSLVAAVNWAISEYPSDRASKYLDTKQNLMSLIAAVNWAISEYPSDRASKYLDTIIENLFSK